MVHFWGQNVPFATNKHFLGKNINIIFIYQFSLTHVIVPNLKIFLQLTQSYEDVPFLDPK